MKSSQSNSEKAQAEVYQEEDKFRPDPICVPNMYVCLCVFCMCSIYVHVCVYILFALRVLRVLCTYAWYVYRVCVHMLSVYMVHVCAHALCVYGVCICAGCGFYV